MHPVIVRGNIRVQVTRFPRNVAHHLADVAQHRQLPLALAPVSTLWAELARQLLQRALLLGLIVLLEGEFAHLGGVNKRGVARDDAYRAGCVRERNFERAHQLLTEQH